MWKWAIGIVAVLIVIGAAMGTPEVKPEDRKYDSIGDVKAAVIKAGYECPTWDKAEESRDLSGSIWTQQCSSGDSILWADGKYGQKVEERLKLCSDVKQLKGRNWEFESDRAAEFQDDLGGVVCDGTPRPAE